MGRESSNTFRLPRGEKLRRAVQGMFRRQRRAVLKYVATGRVKADGDVPDDIPPAALGDGSGDVAAMTPILRMIWEIAAAAFAPSVGLDPDQWEVVNPYTEKMIEDAALAFCGSTNDTTTKELADALAELKRQLAEGIVQRGDSIRVLTDLVKKVFDRAETSRARRIAQTETSRAVHAAQEQAAIASGVVTGWQWLLSSDACPLCNTIARRCPFVKLGQPFAVIGQDSHYSTIKFPPAHPFCNCTVLEVLDSDVQPKFSPTLEQPRPEPEDLDPEVPNVKPRKIRRRRQNLGDLPTPGGPPADVAAPGGRIP